MNNISATAWLALDLVVAAIFVGLTIVIVVASIPRVRDWRAARARPDYVGQHCRRVPFVWPAGATPRRWPGNPASRATSQRRGNAYDGRSDREG